MGKEQLCGIAGFIWLYAGDYRNVSDAEKRLRPQPYLVSNMPLQELNVSVHASGLVLPVSQRDRRTNGRTHIFAIALADE